MNAKQTIPALTQLAPIFAVVSPPVLFGVAAGAVLLWLFSKEKKEGQPDSAPQPMPDMTPPKALPVAPVAIAATASKRITREDVAEALAYGSRPVTRQEAVGTFQALGFGKTAAYKALSPNSRFADFFEIAPDGLIEWKG